MTTPDTTDADPGDARERPDRGRERSTAMHAGLDLGTKRFVVYCAVGVSSIIALVVILVVALMPILRTGYNVPDVLANWGGLIIGFYFGSFITLLKDWSKESVDVYKLRDD